VLEGHDVLYLVSHQARSNYVSNLRTGARTQAYASAIGWCLLGALDASALANFSAQQEFVRFTDHTPMDAAALQARVVDVRHTGFVVSRGFRDPGGSSITAPVYGNIGAIVACVNLSGPDSGFDFDRIDTFYVPETKAAALRISRELGHQGD
tara:strand:+ start:3342 stop:3797 length:456 start_codon:yes stop_codon:yes gene_type:complete